MLPLHPPCQPPSPPGTRGQVSHRREKKMHAPGIDAFPGGLEQALLDMAPVLMLLMLALTQMMMPDSVV